MTCVFAENNKQSRHLQSLAYIQMLSGSEGI